MLGQVGQSSMTKSEIVSKYFHKEKIDNFNMKINVLFTTVTNKLKLKMCDFVKLRKSKIIYYN